MSTDAAIIINNLNLRLPPGFEKRAASIARNIGREMGRLNIDLQNDQQLATLDIGALQVASGETNHVIARRIATAIVKQVHGLQAPAATGVNRHVE